MKNLTKRLLLLTAMFLVIIQLFSVFAEKASAIDQQCDYSARPDRCNVTQRCLTTNNTCIACPYGRLNCDRTGECEYSGSSCPTPTPTPTPITTPTLTLTPTTGAPTPTPTPSCSSFSSCSTCIKNSYCGWGTVTIPGETATGCKPFNSQFNCPSGYSGWYWQSCSINQCVLPTATPTQSLTNFNCGNRNCSSNQTCVGTSFDTQTFCLTRGVGVIESYCGTPNKSPNSEACSSGFCDSTLRCASTPTTAPTARLVWQPIDVCTVPTKIPTLTVSTPTPTLPPGVTPTPTPKPLLSITNVTTKLLDNGHVEATASLNKDVSSCLSMECSYKDGKSSTPVVASTYCMNRDQRPAANAVVNSSFKPTQSNQWSLLSCKINTIPPSPNPLATYTNTSSLDTLTPITTPTPSLSPGVTPTPNLFACKNQTAPATGNYQCATIKNGTVNCPTGYGVYSHDATKYTGTSCKIDQGCCKQGATTQANLFACENQTGTYAGNYTCGRILNSSPQCPKGYSPFKDISPYTDTDCEATSGCCKKDPSVSTPTATLTITPTPAPPVNVNLVMVLNVQDATLSEENLSADLSLYNLTTNSPVSGAPASKSFARTPIPDKHYSANIPFTKLALDKYFIVARRNNMIAKSLFTVTAETGNITVPTTTLVFGDINKDNDINALDYHLLKNCYAKTIVSAPTCASPDFDKNEVIDQIDFNTLIRGWATWHKEGKEIQ